MRGVACYTPEQWRRLWRPFGPDLLLLHHLNVLNYEELSFEDGLRKAYYEFSIALKYRGLSLLDDPLLDDDSREEYRSVLSYSASQVAADYLNDDPDDPVAKCIQDESMGAPLATHLDFFDRIWGRIALFLKTHPPS